MTHEEIEVAKAIHDKVLYGHDSVKYKMEMTKRDFIREQIDAMSKSKRNSIK